MSDKHRKSELKDEIKTELKQSVKSQAKSEGKQLKQLIKDLTPEQRDALLKRLTSKDKTPQLAPRAEGAEVPLSFAQEREWFRYRMFPGVAHNIAGALRLEGTLSIDALRKTLDEIVRRHETLRASFRETDGTPSQTIREAMPLPIDVVETSEAEWHRLYIAEMARPFDLGRDLLLRATLLRLGEEQHILLLTLHHIAADGWSIGVVMRELAESYAAHVSGRPAALPPLAIQYGDFATWQRRRTYDGSYWRTQLENLPPVLELTPDRVLHTSALSAERDHEAATCLSRVESTLKRDLEERSRADDTTLYVTLLTAFMVLMMRCTGREDVVIGSPVSGRTRVETEPLVGLFLNTLALRAKLSPQLTFREALVLVRQTVLDGLAHADVPVERIVQDLGIQRTTNVHPLYETIFNFTPSAPRRIELPGLHVQLEDAPALIEEFSTQLFVTELNGALELDLRYRKQRYSEERMACFVEQYHAILQQVAADPERALGSLDLATPRSRAVLPDPTIALDKPAQRSVPESIAAWIARTPDAPALSQGDETLTYAELGERIDALAQELRTQGMQPGDVVAVRGKRGIDVIIAMSATLQARGILLTLSPDLPEQRHHVMLEEAGAKFILEVAAGAPWTAGVPPAGRVASRCSVRRRDAAVPAGETPAVHNNPAYVFFTSGSTGKPKGVLGTHDGLAHWLAWQRATFVVGPGDRCGQLTGLSFDVVLRDVFLALTSGATLVLPSESDLASADATLRWLDRERITLTHSVPAVAETWLLATRHDGVALSHLARIFFAGEPLTASLVERWREAFPRSGAIVNVYGPTETTLAKCFYRVPDAPLAGVQPLGRTIPETQALVLTPERALCGVGEPGEIAIRTPFRSLGYINAPEENEKRFVPNPFRNDPDDLIYLTGDRGVIGADGVLEFRGRIDHQVKVRGVRVEPMEVTVTLQGAPDVASCAVIAREDGDDGPALVAYVVLESGATENIGKLQEYVAQRLPAAMVPSAFVFLDSLPLTANQKLDRDRLPAPEKARPNLESRYVAPRDAIELQLVEIWEELLDVRPIGVTDRFFEVGGHSLLALRLLVEVEQRLGTKVPLPALFEEPTIAHLAAVLRGNMDEWPLMVTLRAGEHPRKLFLVHPGGGILWNYVHLVRHLPAGVPVYGLQARGLDGKSVPHQDMERLAADYVAEVRRIQPHGPYLLAGHSLGGTIAYEMARQLQESNQEVDLLAMFDSTLPKERSSTDDARGLADMARTIERFVGKDLGVSYETLCTLPSDEQVEYVATALERHDAFLPGHGAALTRNLLSVSKAHVEASRAYRARISPVPITLIRARDAGASDDETLGWSALSPVRILWSPGDHVTMMSEPNVKSLAETLAALVS
jgi:amino acid adenylation domain-containing protein